MQTLNMQVLSAQEIELVVGGAGEAGLVGVIDPWRTGAKEGTGNTIALPTREHGKA